MVLYSLKALLGTFVFNVTLLVMELLLLQTLWERFRLTPTYTTLCQLIYSSYAVPFLFRFYNLPLNYIFKRKKNYHIFVWQNICNWRSVEAFLKEMSFMEEQLAEQKKSWRMYLLLTYVLRGYMNSFFNIIYYYFRIDFIFLSFVMRYIWMMLWMTILFAIRILFIICLRYFHILGFVHLYIYMLCYAAYWCKWIFKPEIYYELWACLVKLENFAAFYSLQESHLWLQGRFTYLFPNHPFFIREETYSTYPAQHSPLFVWFWENLPTRTFTFFPFLSPCVWILFYG